MRADGYVRLRGQCGIGGQCVRLESDAGEQPGAAADLAHERVVRERSERREELTLEFLAARDQFLALEDRDVRQRGCAHRRVAGIASVRDEP